MVLLVVASLTGLGVRALSERYRHAVPREQLLDPGARRSHSAVSGPLNYLLIGSDARAGKPGAGQRSDTIMVAHFSADLDRAYLVSVPRDLFVEIPPNPSTGYQGGNNKINAAFQFGQGGKGGTQLLSSTLTKLAGIHFDGAAIIDFSGFKNVIDQVGGIRVCVDQEVHSIHTGAVFHRGCQEMNGAQALDFARQRYGLPGGDYDRQRHQQQLMRAVLTRATDRKLLANPVKLDQVVRGVGAALTVDTNGVPVGDLALSLRKVSSDTVSGIRMPAYDQMIDDTSYTFLDDDADSLFRALRGDDMDNWVREHPKWVNQL